MSDVLSFNPSRALDANADGSPGALAYFYDAGTTTLRTVYADSALTIPHASPLVANAAGIFPQVYVDGAAVKAAVQNAGGATLYTLDPAVKVAASGATAAQISFAPSTAAPYTNVQAAIDDLAVYRSNSDSNRILNGDFGLWQRGTSFSTAVYGADRWVNGLVGGTVTQSRQAFTLGDVLGETAPTFFLRQTVSGQTLAAHYAFTCQRIEGVRSYAAQTITVLGWAKRFSGSGNMAVDATQYFGTGGSPSADVTAISPATVALSVAWTPFAVVLSVPAVAGKTLGSNGNDFLALNFWTSAGADFNARTNSLGLQAIGVDLWGIHIRAGSWAAADAELYRPRDPGTELALCQRYHEVFSATAGINGSYINGYGFAVTKRAVPTLTVVAGALAGSTWQADANRFVQINNASGASGVGFGCDAEL